MSRRNILPVLGHQLASMEPDEQHRFAFETLQLLGIDRASAYWMIKTWMPARARDALQQAA